VRGVSTWHRFNAPSTIKLFQSATPSQIVSMLYPKHLLETNRLNYLRCNFLKNSGRAVPEVTRRTLQRT
jgi:hypothetical protein